MNGRKMHAMACMRRSEDNFGVCFLLCPYVGFVDQTQAFSHAMQEFLSPELSRGSCISFLVLLKYLLLSLIPT